MVGPIKDCVTFGIQVGSGVSSVMFVRTTAQILSKSRRPGRTRGKVVACSSRISSSMSDPDWIK